MHRPSNITTVPEYARGFSLVAAIFVLVVLAGLGVFLVTISEVQRQVAVQAAQTARAYHAAGAGIEWGIYQGGACGPVTFSLPSSAVDAVMAQFQITVTCTADSGNPHAEGDSIVNVFVISSTATYGTFGNADYVSRTLQVTTTN